MDKSDHYSKPLSVGDWFITIMVLAIPLLNIFMYFYWALSITGSTDRRNFCRASLIWMAVGFGLSLIFIGIGGFKPW